MRHESTVQMESSLAPGVVFHIARMSLARRIELTKRLRELGRKSEFLEAGNVDEQIEAAMLSQEVQRAYLLWGLVAVDGLEIDGEAATPEAMVSKGPEQLCHEAVEKIKAECALTGEERKN